MSTPRKNRSMKKSSKRSKNVRSSKKTRKHIRKMRGGDFKKGDKFIENGETYTIADKLESRETYTCSTGEGNNMMYIYKTTQQLTDMKKL